MSKIEKMIKEYPEIRLIKKDDVEPLSQLMTERFLADPCTMLQLDGIEKQRGSELFLAQCKGQMFAYSDRKAVYTLPQREGFLMGYWDNELPDWKLVSVVMQSGRFVRRILSKPESVVLKENGEYISKISPGNWHKKYIEESRFHILAIAIEEQSKGSGAFRKLLLPFLNVCDKLNLPITLETHNDDNIPIFEHFGFELKEVFRNDLVDVHCNCFLRLSK